MKAMVFAAGLGTRLGKITEDIPKALVPLGGVPALQIVLEKLRRAGFAPIVVNACYKAERIEAFLAENPRLGRGVLLSREPGPEPLETGGGIKFARALLEDSPRFLAHNADIISDADLADFVSKSRPEALASLLVTPARPEDTRFFLFDDSLRLRGWTDSLTGEVRGCGSPEGLRKMSFTGIHLLSSGVFALMRDFPERFSITDFYISQAASQPIYGVEAADLHIVDIGSPESLEKARRLFVEGFFEQRHGV